MRECMHDEDEGEQVKNPGASKSTLSYVAATDAPRRIYGKSHDMDDCYEMVSCTAILPGSEVYNTYGDKLGNAQLLVQYGFLLEGNDHDRITFDGEELEELVRSPGERSRVAELWKRIGEEWCDEFRERLVSQSRLVYSEDLEGPDRSRMEKKSGFRLNGDGKVTDGLWIYCSLTCLEMSGATRIEDVMKVLRRMVDLQIVAEKEIGMDEEDDDTALIGIIPSDYDHGTRRRERAGRLREENQTDSGERDSSSSPTKIIWTMMQAMVSLCEAKKGKLGKPDADLSEVADVRCDPDHCWMN